MNSSRLPAARQYDTDTDIMKIIAAIFVVLIHSADGSSFSHVFFNSISRFSVPVFVMISGYYMLRRKPGGKYLAKKSAKLFAAMLSWAAIYYLYQLLCDEISFLGLRDVLRYLLTQPYHLWYIYAALALYLFTPLLYVFHKNATQKEYRYALALTFFLGSFVVIALRSERFPLLAVIISNSKTPYTLGFIFLYLLGAYLHQYGIQNKTHRMLLYLGGILGVFITFFSAWTFPGRGLPGDLLISFFAPNVMISAVAFFVFIQHFFPCVPEMQPALRHRIHQLSACTTGVYFLHPLILMVLHRYVEAHCFSTIPYILLPQRLISAVVGSFLVVFAAKKIPVLKHLF